MTLVLRRLAAGVMDVVLVSSYVMSVCFVAFQWELGSGRSLLFPVFAVMAPILYFTILESGYGGSSTLGKRLFGLVVLDQASAPLPVYKSALRAIAKMTIPYVFLLGAGSAIVRHGTLILALVLMACLAIPASICVGRGVLGLHDMLVGTSVRGRSDVGAPMRAGGLRYGLMSLLVAGTLAFPSSALLNGMIFGPIAIAPLKSVSQRVAYQPLEAAILKDAADWDLSRYIKNVSANPVEYPYLSATPFPSKFETSATRNFGKSVADFRGRTPLLSIQVELTRRGYESELVRLGVLGRLQQVLPNFLPAYRDPGEFAWVNLRTVEDFGILECSQGATHILLYRKGSAPSGKGETYILEPDDFESRYVGFSIQGL